MSDSSYLLFVGGYLVLLVLMGLFLGKREVGNSDDFMVAGRRLPLLVLVGTLLATWVGGGTVTGSANFIYTYGPFAGLLFFIGAAVG
ncbi:MAG: sodium:solute symporter family protein, partial [Synergistales bacterium]|nr:sodium:solute symporter family protein [Synergistales bacterium]